MRHRNLEPLSRRFNPTGADPKNPAQAAASILLPAHTFDRGNVQIQINQGYADTEPCVLNGGGVQDHQTISWRFTMPFTIEVEREDDGRLAEVLELPGVLIYGQTRQEAIERVQCSPTAWNTVKRSRK